MHAAQPSNIIQEYFINIFRYKYILYHGRARRKEFWFFTLFSSIASLILQIIPLLGLLYALAAIVPGTCLTIRRLHDIGKSGWFLLLALIPLVGGIILIVFCCQDSQPDENQYGLNPKKA
ncbi:MAG: DUF805 domain-containing protein [Deltaproteobacteria bacterium]|nr:DUF805 domain-containing protein [Deltaproteobacteria bacterium]